MCSLRSLQSILLCLLQAGDKNPMSLLAYMKLTIPPPIVLTAPCTPAAWGAPAMLRCCLISHPKTKDKPAAAGDVSLKLNSKLGALMKAISPEVEQIRLEKIHPRTLPSSNQRLMLWKAHVQKYWLFDLTTGTFSSSGAHHVANQDWPFVLWSQFRCITPSGH